MTSKLQLDFEYKSYVGIAVWDSVDSPMVASYGWITERKTTGSETHVFSDVTRSRLETRIMHHFLVLLLWGGD